MDTNRIITYSLLAHINNSGTISKGLLELFIPLVKRAISILNSKGIFSGKNISEIGIQIFELYGIDIPVPVLKNILTKISDEINEVNNIKFILYGDGAYAINNYVFTEFDEIIKKKIKQIKYIEDLFKQFCKTSGISKDDYGSVFSFLEKNMIIISKYLNVDHDYVKIGNFSIEAQFVDFFKKFPPIYEILKDLYLGTIISSYIEYSSPKIESNVELLFDTNFLISLLDLNTPESTHSCRKLVEIAKQNGYSLKVLVDTVEETERLLYRRSEAFNEHFLSKKINPEDIYNACDRRKLSKTDLESIASTIKNTLTNDFGIYIIPYTEKFKHIAKFSKEYAFFKEFRFSEVAALHDATALYYVRDKRDNKKFKSFERVPCWFVNNSINYLISENQGSEKHLKNGYQPETIKADVLLNILWLSNPNVNGVSHDKNFSETGLTCLVSSTLIESMPKNAVIKELDDNINKYASTELTAEEVVRVATRIANKQVINIEELNQLAKDNNEAFVKKLHQEADKQRVIEEKRAAQIEEILSQFKEETAKVSERKTLEKSLSDENEQLKNRLKALAELEIEYTKKVEVLSADRKKSENKFRAEVREQFISKKLKKWRIKSWIELLIFGIIFLVGGVILLAFANWDLKVAITLVTNLNSNVLVSGVFSLFGFVVSSIVVKDLFYKYRHHSNINAYINSIKIPEELREIM